MQKKKLKLISVKKDICKGLVKKKIRKKAETINESSGKWFINDFLRKGYQDIKQ